MTALVEIPNVSQPAVEPRRRWFNSDNLDLVIWCDESGGPTRFQLCHDKGRSERALTWQPDREFTHMIVDDGERLGGKFKAIPILIAGGLFAANRVADCFSKESAELPAEFAEFVKMKMKLRQHPDYVHETSAG